MTRVYHNLAQLQIIIQFSLKSLIDLVDTHFIIDHTHINDEDTSRIVDKKPDKKRIALDVIQKLKRNPNSRIGFQAALIDQFEQQSSDYCTLKFHKQQSQSLKLIQQAKIIFCNQKAEEFKTVHGISGVKVKIDAGEGRFLGVSKEIYMRYQQKFGDYQVKKLRSSQINCNGIQKNVRFYVLIDPTMQIFNERINNLLRSVHQELQIILEKEVFECLSKCQTDISRLFSLIARLDLTLGFAKYLKSLQGIGYCRPKLLSQQKQAPVISIEEGHHPILSTFPLAKHIGVTPITKQSFLQNPFTLTPCHSMTLLTGCNGSGKTTFLRTLQLSLILSQIGCFIPAKSLAFTPLTYLYSRAGTSLDSLENGFSSFMQELKDVAAITNSLAGQKDVCGVVCLDELGLNTSVEQGLPLMWLKINLTNFLEIILVKQTIVRWLEGEAPGGAETSNTFETHEEGHFLAPKACQRTLST